MPRCDGSRSAPRRGAVDNIRNDKRWPDYVPLAVQLGLRSQLGVRIYAEARTVGGLNLYSTTTDAIGKDSIATAHMFAAYAAVALGRVRRESHLLEALRTRDLIGQATGIVMERYGVDADRAFGYLTRVSQTSNTKLRDVAAGLVVDGGGDGSTDIDAAVTSSPMPRAHLSRSSSPDSVD